MFKRSTGILVVLFMLALALTGCQSSKNETAQDTGNGVDKSGWPKQLTAVCGPEGGSGFSLLSVWAPIVGQATGANLSVQATGGNVANTIMVDKGQADMGLSTAALAAEGIKGADWTNNQALGNYRLVAVLQTYVGQYYSMAKSNIDSIDAMKGKHISVGNAGSGSDTWSRRVLDAFGITPGKISNMAPGQGNDLLKDGLLDVQAVFGSAPHNSIAEMQAAEDLTVFGLGKEKSEEFVSRYPGLFVYEIPANTYKNQKEPIYSIAEPVVLIANKDLPDDLVYEITRATFEKQDELVAGYKPFGEVKIQDAQKGSVMLHPGAYKYYVEKGIDIPEQISPK
ncbi:TRAP transporter solute receptor [Desulfocucumis palustris]|uniref:TRAP transporter solute receptor n=1 Tax=Desulfocucumis palustris TaxID=1898651 RepID=A0A2L2XB21_9FIRM|nr:TAXI family TRAP transporter solute-binding subunit [Desulfocucumis palustris]GBF33300.1 TRAP transporter solute receptor [Desulfocucumis palustris]